MDGKHGRTTSGVTFHHRLWTTHTVERRRAWHANITFGQYKRSNDVGRGMPSCLWEAHTIERRRAWHDITAPGQHTRSDYVRRGMTSLPWYSTPGRTTSGVACQYLLWAAHTIKQRQAGHAIIAHGRQTRSNDVRRDMPSPPLDNTLGRTTSGVACHLAFGKHTRSKDVGRGMTSPPLGITHGQTSSGMTCHHRL